MTIHFSQYNKSAKGVYSRRAVAQKLESSPCSERDGTLSTAHYLTMHSLPRLPQNRWTIFVLLALLAFCFAVRSRGSLRFGEPSVSTAMDQLPPVILWAWERPEDFSFINRKNVGVAFLAKTLWLRSDRVVVRRRLQPLTIPDGTQVIAVARVESDRSDKPSLSEQQLTIFVQEISEMASLPRVVAVQVDFDATTSERKFYRDAIVRLREQLKPTVPLSITALGSWCEGDNWLTSLPVDEAVPMLFRMGVDREQILSRIDSRDGFTAKPCQMSVGVSTDEVVSLTFPRKRTYIFSPKPWSADSFNTAMEIYNR
jgi:hypothetical protein